MIIDLTPVRAGTGPSRLLDMVEGRSKQAFARWLADRPQPWRDGVEVVAMDGFTGFKTATTEQLPDAVAVMDPFHVVRLAGDALDQCRRRVQQDLHGHRGRRDDPLYRARRCQGPGDSAHRWSVDLPAGGHRKCPVMANGSAHLVAGLAIEGFSGSSQSRV